MRTRKSWSEIATIREARIPNIPSGKSTQRLRPMKNNNAPREVAATPKKIHKRKIRMVKEAIRTRSHIPLPKLIDATHEQFHEKDKEDLHYHESFSVMYFFMHNTRGKAAIKFAKTLKETKDPEAAHATLFGKDRKRLKKMEALWKSFTLKLDLELAAR